MYGITKLVATLWMSSMARKNPSVRFVTISPGGTVGTAFARDMSLFQQMMSVIIMPAMKLFGKMHSLDVGAKRYVDALLDDGEDYKTGVFYASKKDVSGEVVDQIQFVDLYHNEQYQDNASIAVHKFIK